MTLLFVSFTFRFQLLGEHRRKEDKAGKAVYELGCRLYDVQKRREGGFRVRYSDEDTTHWLGPYKVGKVWLVKKTDVVKELNLKREERLTASRTVYYFIDPRFD